MKLDKKGVDVVKGSFEYVDIVLLKELEQRLEVRETKEESKVFKVCRRCGIRKPLYQFSTDKRNTNGKTSICKKCGIIECSKYYYKNRNEILVQNKKYRDDHKGERTKYFQDYQKDHKEHLQVVGQRWYKKNRRRLKEERLQTKKKVKKDDQEIHS